MYLLINLNSRKNRCSDYGMGKRVFLLFATQHGNKIPLNTLAL